MEMPSFREAVVYELQECRRADVGIVATFIDAWTAIFDGCLSRLMMLYVKKKLNRLLTNALNPLLGKLKLLNVPMTLRDKETLARIFSGNPELIQQAVDEIFADDCCGGKCEEDCQCSTCPEYCMGDCTCG